MVQLFSTKTKTLLVSWSRTMRHPILHSVLVILFLLSLIILGVTYDPHLTFEKHLSNVSANAARKLVIVRKASYIHNDEVINATCFMYFVIPLLDYCSPIWMSASARDLSLLGRVARGGRFIIFLIVVAITWLTEAWYHACHCSINSILIGIYHFLFLSLMTCRLPGQQDLQKDNITMHVHSTLWHFPIKEDIFAYHCATMGWSSCWCFAWRSW